MKRVGDLLGAMLPPSSGAESLLPILRAWPDAVGAPVAREAWPARMTQDGTLVVHVTSSLWASELQMLEGLLREKLAVALAGPAPPLQFRVGTGAAAGGRGRRAAPAAGCRGGSGAPCGTGCRTVRCATRSKRH